MKNSSIKIKEDHEHLIDPEKSSIDRDNDNEERQDRFYENLEKRRWVICFAIALMEFSNAAVWATYSGILDQTQRYYDASLSQVIWFSNVFTLSFTVLSFLGSFFLGFSFKYSMIIGSLMNGCGAWIRYVSGKSFIGALLGQLLSSFAQTITLECPISLFYFKLCLLVVSERWFHAKERLWVVGILVYAVYFGNSIGYFLGPIVIDQNQDLISKLLLIHSIIGTIPIILIISFIKEHPDKMPNFAAVYIILRIYRPLKK